MPLALLMSMTSSSMAVMHVPCCIFADSRQAVTFVSSLSMTVMHVPCCIFADSRQAVTFVSSLSMTALDCMSLSCMNTPVPPFGHSSSVQRASPRFRLACAGRQSLQSIWRRARSVSLCSSQPWWGPGDMSSMHMPGSCWPCLSC